GAPDAAQPAARGRVRIRVRPRCRPDTGSEGSPPRATRTTATDGKSEVPGARSASEAGGGCQKAGANLCGAGAVGNRTDGPPAPRLYYVGGNGVTAWSQDATSCAAGLAGGLGLPLELGAWQPARQLGGVRHRKGDAQGDAHLLGGAVVAEARGVLVDWQVVAVAVVLVLLVIAVRRMEVSGVSAYRTRVTICSS